MFLHNAAGQTSPFHSRVLSDSHQKGAFCIWLHSICTHTFIRQWHVELCPVRRAHSSPGDQKLHQPAHTQLLPPELQVTQIYFKQVGSEEWQCFWGCSNPSDPLPRTNWEKHFQTATEVMKTEAAEPQLSAKFCLFSNRSQPRHDHRGRESICWALSSITRLLDNFCILVGNNNTNQTSFSQQWQERPVSVGGSRTRHTENQRDTSSLTHRSDTNCPEANTQARNFCSALFSYQGCYFQTAGYNFELYTDWLLHEGLPMGSYNHL